MTERAGGPGRGSSVLLGPGGGPGRSASRAARQQSLRHHNLGLVLRHVLDAAHPVSRADLAAATGLTRTTVSALVDRLVDARLVSELSPLAAQRAGRPAVPLVPARGTVAALGMEVNVDYLGVRAVDLAGEVVAESVERGDLRGQPPHAVLNRLAALAAPVHAGLVRDGLSVVGTALALPGLVDTVTGPLRIAPNLGWRDLDVVGLLGTDPLLAAMPPRLGNEANLAARAEAHARRRTGPLSFVYVSGEVGVGGAIVLEGEIFAGRHGWSGEIGHSALGTSGDVGDGGTLEDYAGQDAILDRAGLPRSAPVAELVIAADAGDGAAVDALRVAGAALGTTLATVLNVVDVSHVILGGIYAELAGHLRPVVGEQLRRRVISSPWADIEISVAGAGPYPAMTGGALEVLALVLDDPAGWAGEDAGSMPLGPAALR